MNWFDLLAVQRTLKGLLQHHSPKVSILQHSAFFMIQLSHPYMTTEKIITLTRHAFVSKLMSQLFNMLSRLVIAFLPRSKHLLISCAVTICSNFGAQENKVCHCSHCFPIYLPWSDGIRYHDLSFLNVELYLYRSKRIHPEYMLQGSYWKQMRHSKYNNSRKDYY